MRGTMTKLACAAALVAGFVAAGCARTTEVMVVNAGDETLEMDFNDAGHAQGIPGPLLAGVISAKGGRMTYVGPASTGCAVWLYPWKDGRKAGEGAMSVNIVPGGRTELEVASENGRAFIRNTKIQTNVYK